MIGGDIDGYTEGEEPVVFHYQRGAFRKREAQVYSDLATGKTGFKKGFFRVLVSTQGNKMVFISMLFTFALVFILWVFNNKSNTGVINDVSVELMSFSFDGQVYSSLEFKETKKYIKGSPCAFSVDFESFDSDNVCTDVVSEYYLFGDSSKEKFLRVVFTDYDIQKVKCTVRCGDKTVDLLTKVLHR